MANFGLHDLRLVNPREFPCEKAIRMAAGADYILDKAMVFTSTVEAVSDLHTIYASTARPRDMVKEVMSPEYAIGDIKHHLRDNHKCAILFGPERTGLENEDIVLCNAIINIPTNPEFSSLNIAQSLVVIAYEWFRQNHDVKSLAIHTGKSVPATKEEENALFEHLEKELAASNFFKSEEKRPGMMQNIRNFLIRARFTDQDIRTLRGIIRALAHKH